MKALKRWTAPCTEILTKAGPIICRWAPGFDRATFHASLNPAVVAFL